jgi:putative hemolysin
VNCAKQGGALSIETDLDGGHYGVCTFPADKQCEEWAMMRGERPVGGVDVKGYTTDAARYCAITGGTDAATAKVGALDETDACTLSGGRECDAGEYYAGKGRADQEDASTRRQRAQSPIPLIPAYLKLLLPRNITWLSVGAFRVLALSRE